MRNTSGSLGYRSFYSGQSLFKNFYSVVCHDWPPLIGWVERVLDNGLGGLPSLSQQVLRARRIVPRPICVNNLLSKICAKDVARNYLNRQVDLELGTLARFAGDADSATVLFDDLLHDCEAQSGAAFLRREERFEDPIAGGFVHSFAVVCDRDAREATSRLSVAVRLGCEELRRNPHFGIFLACVDSVRDHVH